LLCPPNSGSAGRLGQDSRTACWCDAHYYNGATPISGDVECRRCPSGCDCATVGATLASLPVKRGYYRINATSIDVRRCPDAAVNCRHLHECPESMSGCRGTVVDSSPHPPSVPSDADSTPMSMCYPDLTGVFCRLCASHNASARVYYEPATTRRRAMCRECGSLVGNTALAVVCGLVALVLGALALSRLPVRHRCCYWLRVSVWSQYTPLVKLKILLSFYVVAGKIDDVYEVRLPPALRTFLQAFAIDFSYQIRSLLDCVDLNGYRPFLVVYMVSPIAGALLIVLAASASLHCSRRLSSSALLELSATPILWLLFLAFPLVSKAAFDAFSCFEFETSGWLKADVAIRCGSHEHDAVVHLAWLAILLYPVGVLLMSAILLFLARHAIQSNKPTPLSRAIHFLHREVSMQWLEPSACR
jgi:hypothetical protein